MATNSQLRQLYEQLTRNSRMEGHYFAWQGGFNCFGVVWASGTKCKLQYEWEISHARKLHVFSFRVVAIEEESEDQVTMMANGNYMLIRCDMPRQQAAVSVTVTQRICPFAMYAEQCDINITDPHEEYVMPLTINVSIDSHATPRRVTRNGMLQLVAQEDILL